MKTLLVLVFTFISGLSFCQPQVYVGPLAGAQLTWTRMDDRAWYKDYRVRPLPSFHGGAQLSVKVRNRFFLHTSLLYATKGRKVEGRQDPLLQHKARYHFIELPVSYSVDFRGRTGGGKEFKYFVGVGPTISYWLGGRGSLYNTDLDESADYASRDLDYSIAFGTPAIPQKMYVGEPNRLQLGLHFISSLVLEPQPRQRFLIMLRYEVGHSFLSRTTDGIFLPTYYKDELQARNMGVWLSGAWMIDIGLHKRRRKSQGKHG